MTCFMVAFEYKTLSGSSLSSSFFKKGSISGPAPIDGLL